MDQHERILSVLSYLFHGLEASPSALEMGYWAELALREIESMNGCTGHQHAGNADISLHGHHLTLELSTKITRRAQE